MNLARLKALLRKHEGLRLKPYRDTVDKLTIGVGRNLDDVGISFNEAEAMLDNDIQTAVNALTRTLPWFAALDDVRQEVLIDMCFNMGIITLVGKNPKMLAAIQKKNYGEAAIEMLSGPWKDQVHARAIELSEMMRTGEA
jgi:lysozyme